MEVMEVDYIKIGRRVREARKALGWQQAELAFRAGLTTSRIPLHHPEGVLKHSWKPLQDPEQCFAHYKISAFLIMFQSVQLMKPCQS